MRDYMYDKSLVLGLLDEIEEAFRRIDRLVGRLSRDSVAGRERGTGCIGS
jgi:hypothetical protein